MTVIICANIGQAKNTNERMTGEPMTGQHRLLRYFRSVIDFLPMQIKTIIYQFNPCLPAGRLQSLTAGGKL
ncbi:hypothetical protein BEL04_23510 [Mucilaginibacter sp. PPCGB 2223]|nr:hypothetical protein BEL04_23510 [Mucilaginibacter sp. PPCGB 2223]